MPPDPRPVVRVAVPSPLRRLFDYLLPPAMAGGELAGCRVRVPFGAREVVGVVLAVTDQSDVPAARLKPVTARLDQQPALPPDLLALLRWAADYYHHAPGDVLSTALPVLLRQGEPAGRRRLPVWRVTPGGVAAPASATSRSAKQAAALAALVAQPDGIPRPLLDGLGIERSTLVALQKKGFAEEVELDISPRIDPASIDTLPLLAESPLSPNAAQAQAIDTVRAAAGTFRAFLVEGVTGSGKTEVYLQLAADTIARGEQVLVLVPEIGLTPQTVDRFRRRFNRPVAVMHSGLNDRERLDAWLDAAEGRAAIVLGTRSAIFAPLAKPGLVIVDEEHDGSYKQQDGFRYHARDLAILRARNAKVPVLLGSATPSLESLHNAQSGKFTLLRLPARAGEAATPRMDVIDIRRQKLVEGLSEPLRREMNATLARGEQVLLFLNRRGFAPVLVCHDCGWTADCRGCDARYTFHLDPRHLHCHHCGRETAVPRACPRCGGTDLVPVGLGTERIEQALPALLPKNTPVLRIDSDTTRGKHALPRLFAQVQDGGPLVLVGTQMLAKGHHFPHVTLVGILDADGGLLSADFRAGERLAQVLVQVAGRAGRAERPGRVLVQTRQPDHPLLVRLLRDGYDAWARDALAERRSAELPPFGVLALLRAEAARETTAIDWLENLKVQASHLLADPGANGDVMLMGPAPAPMARRGGRYRAQLLVQAASRAELHRFLQHFVPAIEADPESRRVRWSLDVDPQDLY
ncbi:MAG: primosomal protein N' [Gammaproteobacteria bacterium]